MDDQPLVMRNVCGSRAAMARYFTARELEVLRELRATFLALEGRDGREFGDYWESEEDLELYDAYTADEIIICSTAGGLLPVAHIDGRAVGAGKPGPAFAKLSAAYERLLNAPQHGTDVGLQLQAAS